MLDFFLHQPLELVSVFFLPCSFDIAQNFQAAHPYLFLILAPGLMLTIMPSLILTTDERIRAVEAIIDYEFVDKTHLEKALAAAGATTAPEGNKPGALLGDGLLRLVIDKDSLELGYSTGET